MFRAAEVSELALECLDLFAQDERGFLADTVEHGKDFVAQFSVFSMKIEQRDFHRMASCMTP